MNGAGMSDRQAGNELAKVSLPLAGRMLAVRLTTKVIRRSSSKRRMITMRQGQVTWRLADWREKGLG